MEIILDQILIQVDYLIHSSDTQVNSICPKRQITIGTIIIIMDAVFVRMEVM